MGSETRARLALGGLLVATLMAYSQLFADGAYFGATLLGVIIALGLAVVVRKLGAGTAVSSVASGVGLLWYLTAVFESRRLLYGLPTLPAVEHLVRALGRAAETSRVDFAPIPGRPGYVILVVTGFWFAAAFGEIATFRWRRPLLATLAPTGLVAIVLVVGTGAGGTMWVVFFLVALLSFWGLESSHRLRSWGRWVSPWAHHNEEPQSLTGAVARRMGASCVAVAIVAPLLLPAFDDGLLSWRTGTGSGGGFGSGGGAPVDVLVSLAPTLLEQKDIEFFTVETTAPTYWRLTSLAAFDGQDWKTSDFDAVPLDGGQVTSSEPPLTQYEEVSQRFTIGELKDDLMPAAVRPERLRLDGSEGSIDDVALDPATGELRYQGGLQPGLTYEVDSRVPQAERFEALAGAAVGDPGDEFTQLPPGISAEVDGIAGRWTQDAGTPFEKLVSIQEHLRGFAYSTDVEAEDSSDYLTEFLTETRAGYCQQFATAFAVLARMNGLPTRVSVGFLPGTPSEDDSDTYVVSGRHAHAWPEVYFEDFGWVRFEPTPRSEASEPAYTVPATDGLPLNRAGIQNGVGGPTDPRLGNRFELDDATGAQGAGGRAGAPAGARIGRSLRDPAWVNAFGRFARTAFVLALVLLIAVPLLKELRTGARYRRARSPEERAAAAFAHFEDEATEFETARRRAESASAYAMRMARAERVSERIATSLARIYESAEYGPEGISAERAAEATDLARSLQRAMWGSASWWERVGRLFSLRRLVPRRGGMASGLAALTRRSPASGTAAG